MMSHPHGFVGRKRANGFSLIELLVVVGLMALLVALLLPTLENARNTARLAWCSANLRQMQIAVRNYATENHSKYPRANRWVYNPSHTRANQYGWVRQQYGHVMSVVARNVNIVRNSRDGNILFCPSDGRQVGGPGPGGGGNRSRTQAGWNHGPWGSSISSSYGHNSYVFNRGFEQYRTTDVARPSQSSMFMDANRFDQLANYQNFILFHDSHLNMVFTDGHTELIDVEAPTGSLVTNRGPPHGGADARTPATIRNGNEHPWR